MEKVLEEFIKAAENYKLLTEQMEHTKRNFGGVMLNPSEIHTLTYVSGHIGANFSDIAKGMGITKGALTKLMNKLLDKSLVEKYSEPDDARRVFFEVTAIGAKAVNAHEDFHRNAKIEPSMSFRRFAIENEAMIELYLKHVNLTIDSVREQVEREGE